MTGLKSSLLSAFVFVAAALGATTPSPQTQLYVNTLVGINGASAFQCWAVLPPFTVSTQPGTVGAKIQSLGNSTGGSVVFFNETAPTDAGIHRAPAPQWVLVLAGSGVLTLPTNGKTLALPTGSIIIANDTADVSELGHNTQWTAGTVAVQLPFSNGVVGHTVVNNGPCATLHHHN